MDNALKSPFVRFQVAPPSIVLSVPTAVPRYTTFGSFGSIAMAVAPTPSIPLLAAKNVDASVRALEEPPEAGDVDRLRRRMRRDRRLDRSRARTDRPPCRGPDGNVGFRRAEFRALPDQPSDDKTQAEPQRPPGRPRFESCGIHDCFSSLLIRREAPGKRCKAALVGRSLQGHVANAAVSWIGWNAVSAGFL